MTSKMLSLAAVAAVAWLAGPIAEAGAICSTNGTAAPTFFPANGAAISSTGFHAFQFTVAADAGGALGEWVTAGNFLSTAGGGSAFTESFQIFSDASNSIGSLLDTLTVTGSGDGVSRL